MPTLTMKQAAQMALDVQNAVNLSGVVHSFAEVMHTLSEEANRIGQGTEWKNMHSVVTLFLDKLASLNGYGYDSTSHVNRAFDAVKQLARE
jgi:hypothetical protein